MEEQGPHPLSYVKHEKFQKLEQKFKDLEERHNYLLTKFNEVLQQQQQKNETGIYYFIIGYSFSYKVKQNEKCLRQGIYSFCWHSYLELHEMKQIALNSDKRAKAYYIQVDDINITSYSIVSEEAFNIFNKRC